MSQTTTLTYHALPKQKDFLRSPTREVLYSGAFGAGKTYALALKAFVRACHPGAREGLFRKHGVTLKRTTLKTLLEGDGTVPPVIPRGACAHLKAEQIVRVHGGGEIVYGGLDDPDKIGSYNLTGCGIDEAVEVTEDDWTVLRGRIRVAVPGLPNQIYGACNPGPPSHFLARRFGLGGGAECAANCEAIQTRSTDNTHLPADYIADLMSFTGLRKARYVEGKWVGSEGLVYDRWDRGVHVRVGDGGGGRVVLACDDGYTNPFVCLRLVVDGDGRVHVDAEHYDRGLLMRDKVAAVRGGLAGRGGRPVAGGDGRSPGEGVAGVGVPVRGTGAGVSGGAVEAVICDPSAADLIAELRNAGLPVVPADNDVFDGIGRVQQRLEPAGDGRPRLTVDPGCRNTIAEFETYEWDVRRTAGGVVHKDAPRKEHDHAMDALRYGVAYLDAGPRVVAAFAEPGARRHDDAVTVTLPSFDELRRRDPEWGWR